MTRSERAEDVGWDEPVAGPAIWDMIRLSAKFFDSTENWLFFSLFFLTPLVFVFNTNELFEFPKTLLLYFFALLILTVSLLGRGLKIRSVPYPKPLLLWLAANLLAAIFSTSPLTSFFGYYTRFNGGLLSTFALFLIALVYGQKVTPERMSLTLKALLASATLVSAYAVLQNFGLDKNFWVQDSQARAFASLGQPNWLAAYLLVVLPLPVYFFLTARNPVGQLLSLFLSLLFYSAFWFTYSLAGFLGFLVLTFFLILSARSFLRERPGKIILVTSLMLIISLLRPGIFGAKVRSFFETVRPVINLLPDAQAAVGSPTAVKPRPAIDTGDIRLIVWRGALRLWLSTPKIFFLGAGPETFAYNFLRFRPREMNQTTEWDFLYNKAHNYYLDLLTGVGLLGFLAYAAFSLIVLKDQLKNSHPLARFLLAGWLTIFVTNFFGWPTAGLSLLFFIYPLIMNGLETDYSSSAFGRLGVEKLLGTEASEVLPIGRVAVLVPVFLFLALKIFGLFRADVAFIEGQKISQSGDLENGHRLLSEATRLNFFEPAYHKELAYGLAQEFALSQNPRAGVLQQALGEAAIAYRLNPQNSLTLRSLIRVYYLLAKSDPAVETKLLNLAAEIIRLSPTEPRSYYDAALVNFYFERKEETKILIQKALALKPDYPEALELLQKLLGTLDKSK